MAEYNNRLNELVVIPTLKCDLKCEHCCRCSGPKRTERMDEKLFMALRRKLPDYIGDITISGGEPFLDMDLLLDTVSSLPECDMVYIATNGLWTKDGGKRFRFFSDVLPALKDLIGRYGECVTVELSRDQYHRYQKDAMKYWNVLRLESEDGCFNGDVEFSGEPEEDDFEDEDAFWDAYYEWEQERDECGYYVYPDMEKVTLCERPEYMRTIKPLGRGKRIWHYSSEKEYCSFDGNDKIENSLTIFPDGRVSACCDGGAWVGNILTQSLPEIFRQRRSFLFWMRRQVGTYLNGGQGVPIKTCEQCEAMGKKFFGHKFKEEECITEKTRQRL